MTLSVPVSPKAEARLRERAAAAGIDIETFAARELERLAARPRSLAEISGPLYQEFLASGMTDDQLGDLLEQAKHETRAQRRGRPQP